MQLSAGMRYAIVDTPNGWEVIEKGGYNWGVQYPTWNEAYDAIVTITNALGEPLQLRHQPR